MSAAASTLSQPVTTTIPVSAPNKPEDHARVQQPTATARTPLSNAIGNALAPAAPKDAAADVNTAPTEQQETKSTPAPQPMTAATLPRTAAGSAVVNVSQKAEVNVTQKAEVKAANVEATHTPQPDFRARMDQRKAERAREAAEAQAREAREAERLKRAEEEAARQEVRLEEQRKRDAEATHEQELLNERVRAREEAAEQKRTAEARRKLQEEEEVKAKRAALENQAAANLDVYTARVLEARKVKAAEAEALAAAQPVGTSTPGPQVRAWPHTSF